MLILKSSVFLLLMENLQGVAGFPVVDAAAVFEMEEEKEKSKNLINSGVCCELWESFVFETGFKARN